MERVLTFARIALALAGAFAFAAIGGLALYWIPQISLRAINAEDKMNGALDTVNRRGGLLENADGAARGVRLTADAFGRIAWHEEQRAPMLDSQVDQMLNHAQDTMSHIDKTADAATLAIDQGRADLLTANQSIREGQALIEAYTRTGDALDQTIQNPALNRTITGLADSSTNVAQITGDLQKKLHPILSPSPCTTRWCAVRRRVWPAVDAGSRAAESGYWLTRFIELLHR